MVGDLLWHELEALKSFYARAMSWAITEAAAESAKLASLDDPDNETIEATVTHPQGAYSLEQVAIRSVVNELNALCEFALQNTWVALSKQYDLPNGEFVYTTSRGKIEKALLSSQKIDVKTWPQWHEVEKIKEMSEGFKHRQRMQPFPVKLQRRGFEWRATRVVDPNNGNYFADYEPTPLQAAQFLKSVEELLLWLRRSYVL